MGNFFLKNMNYKFILLYFIPLYYMYINIILHIVFRTGEAGVSRAPLILFILVFGFLLTASKSINRPMKYAILFTLFMLLSVLVATISPKNPVIYISCLIAWPISLFICSNVRISDKDVNAIAVLGTLSCNLIAFFYIKMMSIQDLNFILDVDAAVSAYNSIYYVLLSLPYIFLLRRSLYVLISLILPLTAFVISTKTTCLLSFGIIVIYYFYNSMKNFKHLGLKIIFLVFIVGVFLFMYDLDSLYDGINEDIASGGNGRVDIAYNALNIWTKSDIMELMFGHGPESITRVLHIGGHNDFLETIFCFGFVGFILLLLFCCSLIIEAKKITNDINHKSYVISLIVFFVCLTSSKLLGTQIQMLLLTSLWGIIYQINKYKIR